jgi:hypothetical protein
MDFEEIDVVLGDTIDTGDIICDDGEFHRVKGVESDEMDIIVLDTANLSTGYEGEVVIDPDAAYPLFRAY